MRREEREIYIMRNGGGDGGSDERGDGDSDGEGKSTVREVEW